MTGTSIVCVCTELKQTRTLETYFEKLILQAMQHNSKGATLQMYLF